jgi:pyruvate ferredoxin oxidoreductase beta subunit
VEIGKLAVKSGMWVLYEREKGKLTISAPSKAAFKKTVPLEEYLSLQGRFKGIDPKTVMYLKDRIAENQRRLLIGEAMP